jgi:hypothetical protein
MSMNGFRVGLFLTLCLLLLGCGSARYQINVGNGNPRLPIQQVMVEADDREVGEFSVIAPSKVAAAKPRGGDLPEKISVRWVDTKGEVHTATIPVGEAIRPDFKGQLVVEITEENSLTLTQVESSGEELSALPWALPEAWEGSVQMPGMQ